MCRAGGPRCPGSGGPSVQSGPVNVAGGDDVVDMQVGRVVGGGYEPPCDESVASVSESAGSSRVTNIVSGNARVGAQMDTFVGELNIQMWPRR